MVQTLKQLRIYLVGLSKKIVSNIGRLSHHDVTERGMDDAPPPATFTSARPRVVQMGK